MNTNQIGRITEAKVLAKLVELGKHVLVPFSNVGRYDLLIDNLDGTFVRIECKTGRYRNGVIIFNTGSSGGYKKKELKYMNKDYSKDADFFGIWCRDTGGVYFVSVKECSIGKMWLRIDAPNNRSNKTKIKFAKDYVNLVL